MVYKQQLLPCESREVDVVALVLGLIMSVIPGKIPAIRKSFSL
jgi:hypothetical protein